MSVSVVVPCRNEAKYIEKCIKSIIEQSDYSSISEIFVVILVIFGKFARYALMPTNSDSSDSCFDVINK